MADEPFNPYAPPKVDWVAAPNPATLVPQQWWFEGEELVVLRGASLPTDICVKTGQPTSLPPVHKKVQWVHPAVAITVVISPIIFLILYFIFRKTGELTYAVSPEFLKRRKLGIGLIVGPLVPILAAIPLDMPALAAVFGLLWVISMIVGIVIMMPFQIKKIDKEKIHMKVDKRFTAALAQRR